MEKPQESGKHMAEKPLRFRLRRTLYELRLVDGLIKDHMQYGSCDHWSQKNPVIRIDSSLKGRQLLDVLIHEMAHAYFDDLLKEEAINDFAEDVARLLTKMFPTIKDFTL
jgi:hypothetical protein